VQAILLPTLAQEQEIHPICRKYTISFHFVNIPAFIFGCFPKTFPDIFHCLAFSLLQTLKNR